jgi:two-component system phosphate regulon sensor histidine kinase PhoR
VNLDRLSLRLFASFAALILSILAAAAVWGELRIRRFHLAEVDRRLEVAADLLIERASASLARPGPDPDLDARMDELGRLTGLRLTIVRADGEVIADSESELPAVNHADRPEVARALSGARGTDERRSATTGVATQYLALPVTRDGIVNGCVRAAAQLDEMESALGELRTSLLFVGGLALGGGLLLSGMLARRIAAPLESMAAEARALGAGDLGRRVALRGPVETRTLAQALNTMADRLEQRMAGEHAARVELEAVLGAMVEGVFAVDDHERVMLMNAACARHLGLMAPLPPGDELWRAMRFPALERELRDVLASSRTGDRALPTRVFDAPSPARAGLTLALSVSPLRVDRARRGAVVLLADVTTTRQIDQMRVDFVANVSHELRTPLTAIMGALETLSEPDVDPVTRERFIDIAARNARRLRAIVNDLLDLSTIESKPEELVRGPVSSSEAVRAAAAALAGSAQQKGVSIDLQIPRSSEPDVIGHEARLEQCFTNLIANAIQYTPSGGAVTLRSRSAGRDVLIEIEDTGIGIPSAALPRVFERFYRVDRGRARDTGGTGLGLALVKHIVLAHGGSVDVESVEGRGSTFTVKLPRRQEA